MALARQVVDAGTASEEAVALLTAFSAFGPGYRRWLEGGAREEGLSVARLRVLAALHADGPQIMTDLRRRLGVTARNVTQLVDGLEAEALVRREPHPDDRRATVVTLTDVGTVCIVAGFAGHAARASALFDRLDVADRLELLRLLGMLIEHLEALGVDVASGSDHLGG